MLELIARVLIASVFVVMGIYRLSVGLGIAGEGAAAVSRAAMIFSAVELVIGVLVMIGWKVRWLGLVATFALVVDAVMLHKFWNYAGSAYGAQLLHFMKNICAAGAFLLLAATARR